MNDESLPTRPPFAEALEQNVAAGVHAWRFDRFEFDLQRGELRRREGAPIALRPKAELLLRLLLAQPGRLFGRDELMAAVWPGAVVTDDSLVQCVGELRAALDDGAQRLIRTVPRRGYRFEAVVEPLSKRSAAVSIVVPAVVPQRPGTGWLRRLRPLLGAALLLATAAWVARSSTAPMRIDDEIIARHVVAVMPFSVSATGSERAVADALADEIASQIARRSGMTAIGRSRTAAFFGAVPDVDGLARRLKVRYVLVGRVDSDAARRLQIDVQMLSVDSSTVVWADRFVHEAAPESTVSASVAPRIASAVRIRFGDLDSARALRPGHRPDAADLTLLAWQDLDRRTGLADIDRARDRFRRAVRENPDSVIASTGVVASYVVERMDPRSRLTESDLVEAEQLIDRALKLAPNDATAMLSWGMLQMFRGRADLALPMFERVRRTVPSQSAAWLHSARALVMLGRIDEVQAQVDRVVQLSARDSVRLSAAHALAAQAALMRGEDELAYEMARRAMAERPGDPEPHALSAALDALAGRTALAGNGMAAYLALRPGVTLATFEEPYVSTHPAFRARRARLYEGLRKAGLPE